MKPEGLLAVFGEKPPINSKPPEGVSQNLSVRGIQQKIPIERLTSAGFQVVSGLTQRQLLQRVPKAEALRRPERLAEPGSPNS